MIITIDSNVHYPSWVYETWRISSGLDIGQTVTFRPNASATDQTQAWGKLTTTTVNTTTVNTPPTQVEGVTSSQPLQKFSIDLVGGQLICFSWPLPTSGPRSLRRIGAIALGVSAGAAIGVWVGLAAGFPGSPFLRILTTALFASIVSAISVHTMLHASQPSATGGPSPTWVANDGGAGSQKDQQRTAPALKAMGANALRA
jgi:hypothetical protein